MAESRITGGEWRGRPLTTPRGMVVRPTRGMVRQALFNILGARVSGARVVDLYAGAGSLGFEALSRGAARATFVDQRAQSLALIAATARRFGCEERVELVTADAVAWLRRGPAGVTGADICFVDAPYRDDRLTVALELLGDLAPGLLVCEHHRARALPAELGALTAVRTAHYGLTDLTIYQRRDQQEPSP
ncbi:MAG: 16S rRNA (guanine(966)-N(2))-methyltransferase RsmD [Candidatus Dormibacteria bacterium]